MKALALGLPEETNNYRYSVVANNAENPSVITTAFSKKPETKNYIGAVFVLKNSINKSLIISGICEANIASNQNPKLLPSLNIKNQQLECPSDYQLLDLRKISI
jgi:hypothetical protein